MVRLGRVWSQRHERAVSIHLQTKPHGATVSQDFVNRPSHCWRGRASVDPCAKIRDRYSRGPLPCTRSALQGLEVTDKRCQPLELRRFTTAGFQASHALHNTRQLWLAEPLKHLHEHQRVQDRVLKLRS